MNKIQQYLTIASFIFLCSACETLILGPDESNDPRNNFELFWKDFDQHYGLFIARGWDWNAVYDTYSPQVNNNTSDEELWNIFIQMIEGLDDSHVQIKNTGKGEIYTSGFALNKQAIDEFSLDLVLEAYVSDFFYSGDKGIPFGYGKVKNKDIGYVYIGGMGGHEPEEIDEMIAALKHHKAIIFDIRNNKGGVDKFGARLAGVFADGEHFIYTVQTRNGPDHNDFDEKRSYYTGKGGREQFLKPVIVLTDRSTISAAEIFLLHMKSFSHVTQLGDTTAGDFSDVGMTRFLPNGMRYKFSIQMYLLPDGRSLDGIGHVPEVYSKNTEADIKAGNDLVMKEAIQYLFDHYGIE